MLQGDDRAPMPDEVEVRRLGGSLVCREQMPPAHLSPVFTARGLQNLNNLAVVCLECCSNAVCNDDDFDDSTGNCKGVGYYDVWRLRCRVAAGWTTISSQITTFLRDKQIRERRSGEAQEGWCRQGNRRFRRAPFLGKQNVFCKAVAHGVHRVSQAFFAISTRRTTR